MASTLGNMGDVLEHQGRLDEAMAAYKRALAIQEAAFGPQHTSVASTLVGMGDVPVDVKSSWAGAMGNMQFIPTTFEAYAVDHDGDGKRGAERDVVSAA